MEWRERIDRAIKRGTFTDAEYKLANSYATCAVGERIAQLRGQGIKPNVRTTISSQGGPAVDVEVPVMSDIREAAIMFFSDVANAGRPGYGTPEVIRRWYDKIQAWDGS